MRIGLIDVDGHNFPNIPLMKISAYHKQNGDRVEWYDPWNGLIEEYDKVYVSKVFSFSDDYEHPIYAKETQRGGSGYCIRLVDGKEVYDKSKDIPLPYEIEHIYPDYSIYYGKVDGIEDTAYGRLTLGCPRGCGFCHTGVKDGLRSHKVADLSEFWDGQKNIVLIDQNILACRDWKNLLQQLIDSKAFVDFNGGLDARLVTEEKAKMLAKLKVKSIHFAYDRYEDKKIIEPKLRTIKEFTGWDRHKVQVYVLINYNTNPEQDLDRIYFLKSIDFAPYVMIYDKKHTEVGSYPRCLQRFVNNRILFNKVDRFDDYENWRKSKHYFKT